MPAPRSPRAAPAERVLACTVRGCACALERSGRAFVCARGHSFDVARSGYLNLLQPQDRRSLAAGDSADVVRARARLEAAGIGRALASELRRTVAELALAAGAVAVELGSGTGALLFRLAREHALDALGIDLSVAAAEHAARAHPGLAWVVANADRRLPLVDGSVTLLLSVHARRRPDELARVLAPGGRLLVAVPAADDLLELRAALLGRGETRDRAGTLLRELAPFFALERRSTARERSRLSSAQLLDCLRSTYRGGRRSERERLEALGDASVTRASEVLLFASSSGR